MTTVPVPDAPDEFISPLFAAVDALDPICYRVFGQLVAEAEETDGHAAKSGCDDLARRLHLERKDVIVHTKHLEIAHLIAVERPLYSRVYYDVLACWSDCCDCPDCTGRLQLDGFEWKTPT